MQDIAAAHIALAAARAKVSRGERGSLPGLFAALRAYRSVAAAQLAGLAALTERCEGSSAGIDGDGDGENGDESRRTELVLLGACEAVAAALKAHPGDPRVLLATLHALGALIGDPGLGDAPPAVGALCAAGAAEALVASLLALPTDAEAQWAGCKALAALCRHAAGSAAGAALAALRAHPGESRLQLEGLAVVAFLNSCSAFPTDSLDAAMDAAARAMRQFPTEHGVQALSCVVLCSADQEGAARAASRHGADKLVVAAMRLHAGNFLLLNAALEAFAKILKYGPEALSKSIPEVPRSAEIVAEAAATVLKAGGNCVAASASLALLSTVGPEFTLRTAAAALPAALEALRTGDAMRAGGGAAGMEQPTAPAAAAGAMMGVRLNTLLYLLNVLQSGAAQCGEDEESPESRRAVANGAVEAVVAAMRAHEGAWPLQRLACAALMMLVSGDSSEHCRRAADAGAAEAIRSALRDFPESDVVQAAGDMLLPSIDSAAAGREEEKEGAGGPARGGGSRNLRSRRVRAAAEEAAAAPAAGGGGEKAAGGSKKRKAAAGAPRAVASSEANKAESDAAAGGPTRRPKRGGGGGAAAAAGGAAAGLPPKK